MHDLKKTQQRGEYEWKEFKELHKHYMTKRQKI